MLLNKNVKEKNNPVVNVFNKYIGQAFRWCFNHKGISLCVAFTLLGATLFSTRWMGTEFLPPLNEGALWVEAKLPMSSSLNETVKTVHELRAVLNSFRSKRRIVANRSQQQTVPTLRVLLRADAGKPQAQKGMGNARSAWTN